MANFLFNFKPNIKLTTALVLTKYHYKQILIIKFVLNEHCCKKK